MNLDLDEYPDSLLKGSQIYRAAARRDPVPNVWCDCGHSRIYHASTRGYCFYFNENTGLYCTCDAFRQSD